MKQAHGFCFLASLALALATSITFAAQEQLAKGDEPEVSYDGLLRLEKSAMDEAYIKPDIDLSGYSRIMIDPVPVSYKRKPSPPAASMRASGSRSNFALTDQQMEKLSELFQETFAEAMARNQGWEVVESPGPDVLRVEAELIDLVIKVPTRTTTGTSHFFLTEIGEVTLVAEIRDSESREILGRVVDRSLIKPAGTGYLTYTNVVSAWADVRRLFDIWADLIRQGLDQIREVSGSQAGG
jgi:hypothetical protein